MGDFKETEVIYGDRGRCCNEHNGDRGNGWGAVGGALVGGGFGAAAVSIWDKVNDTKASIESVKSSVAEARAGIYKDIADSARGTDAAINGTAKEVLNNRFVTERGLCDLGYKTNVDIRNTQDVLGANDRAIMDRLCQMEHAADKCCCETNRNIDQVKYDLALQMERGFCEVKNGQQEIKCLIENQAKDNEISRLNRVINHKDHEAILTAIAASKATTA